MATLSGFGDCRGAGRCYCLFRPAGCCQSLYDNFIRGATQLEQSAHLKTLNGGWQIGKDIEPFGIGVGAYRLQAAEMLSDIPNARPDNHPHNYYLQMLAETGIIVGFQRDFSWRDCLVCFRAGLR